MYNLTEKAVRVGNRYVDLVGWYLISPVGTISGFVSIKNAANGVFSSLYSLLKEGILCQQGGKTGVDKFIILMYLGFNLNFLVVDLLTDVDIRIAMLTPKTATSRQLLRHKGRLIFIGDSYPKTQPDLSPHDSCFRRLLPDNTALTITS